MGKVVERRRAGRARHRLDTIAAMHAALQARTRIVQSPANRWVKALRAALLRPPALAAASGGEAPLLALEGFHLVGEALRSGLAPAALFLRVGEEASTLDTLQDTLGSEGLRLPQATELLALAPSLFANLMQTAAPQPIAALIPVPQSSVADMVSDATPLVLVLAALQDPGNTGTLLRSAEAFGATAALLLAGTATPWSSKSLRASAGSALRLPLLAMRGVEEAAALLRSHSIRSYAAVASGGSAPADAPLHQPAALWIGNEGAGLSAAELAACDARITLPMPGAVESLNAAVAGSLLLYEASRQRSAGRHA